MRKLMMGALLALLLPFTTAAAEFVEGKDYLVVSKVATAGPEVREFFSVLCGHCYKFEPTAQQLKKQLAAEVRFERNHVDFVGREIGAYYSRAYAVAVALGKEDTLLPRLFHNAQVEKRYFQSPTDVRNFFLAEGVSAEQYDGVVNSFAVEGMVAMMAQNTIDKKIQGVPAFVVNGKYLVKNDALKTYDDLIKVVNYLLTLK